MPQLLAPLPRELFEAMWERYGKPADFVTRMKATMEAHGITQAAVAAESGFHFTHVSRWLGKSHRKHLPGWETMALLDEALARLLLAKEGA